MNHRVLRPGDEGWPIGLSELGPHNPPSQIYVCGHELPPMDRAVAIVGTRRPTMAGIEAARSITRGLVENGFTIVSGLALGIDAVAHRETLEAGGRTVAVLGTGLDVDYPRNNRRLKGQIVELGTLVSEFQLGTAPQTYHFPQRNRLIAGMCTGTVVVEGGIRSGALITARFALDGGRMVWAVPGSYRNSMAVGPNELIRRGEASLATSPEHVLEELIPGFVPSEDAGGQMSLPLQAAENLGPDERAALTGMDDSPTHPETLAIPIGLPAREVARALTRLELKRYVARRGAGYEITAKGAEVRKAVLSLPTR